MKRMAVTFIMLLAIAAMLFARECVYCGGTGKIAKNISSGTYGHQYEVKEKCKECGGMFYPSTGHTHIHCKYCGGTGKAADGGNSGSLSSSEDGYYWEAPSVSDLDYNVMMLEAQMSVKTQYYGVPITQNERALMDKLSPEALKNYGVVREIINQGTIYASEAIQKNWASSMSTSEVVNYFNNMTSQMEKNFNTMIQSMQTQPMDVVMSLQKLTESRMTNMLQLFETLNGLVQMSNVTNNLDNLKLLRNLF